MSWVVSVSRVGGRWVVVAWGRRLGWWVVAGAGGYDGVDERIVDHVVGLVCDIKIVIDWGRWVTWAGSDGVR